MNMISDYDAHKRDEDFDREDRKHRAPVTHAQRVAFADAMMAAPCVCTPIRCDMECPACGGPSAKTPCKAEPCTACDGDGLVSVEDSGNITEASCNECSREKS
jgi:DnaJ-class molecular chaperone